MKVFTALLLRGSLLLLALSGCASWQSTPPTVQHPYQKVVGWADRTLQKAIEKKNIAGVSVVLVADNQVVWQHGYGIARLNPTTPLTAQTPMQVGSISKLFTAMAIMQLVEQGRVSLQDSAADFFPELDPIVHRYTLGELLTHRSGVRSDYWYKWQLSYLPKNHQWHSAYRTIPEILSFAPPPFPPRQVSNYSNIGFGLLGNVVEQISGEPFVDYMQRHVLKPLGMQNASFVNSDAIKDTLAYGIFGESQTGYYRMRDIPATALTASAADMGRFLLALFNGGQAPATRQQVLQPNTLEQMLKPHNQGIPLDGRRKMGLGFFLDQYPEFVDVPVVSHDGSVGRFVANLIALPEQKMGVVVMANSPTASKTVKKVSRELLQRCYEARLNTSLPKPKQVFPVKRVKREPADLKALEGFYTSSLGLVKITHTGKRTLRMRFRDKNLALTPVSNRQYRLSYPLLGVIPLRPAPINTMRLKEIDFDGRRFLNLRIDGIDAGSLTPITPSPIAPQWRERLGRYVVINDDWPLIREMTLALDPSGFITAEARKRKVPVDASAPDRLQILGLGRYLGETIEWLSDHRLRYSGLIYRRVDR